MDDPSNISRAEAAKFALAAVPQKYGAIDEDAVVDLITDLLHLAFANKFVTARVILYRAIMNFEAEVDK